MVAFVKADTRQSTQAVVFSIAQTDLPTGEVITAFDIPKGAIITAGGVYVITPFDSVTSDALDIGFSTPHEADDPDYYVAAADVAQAAETRIAYTAKGRISGANETVTLTNTATGTEGTAGEILVILEYTVEGRATENYG